MRNRSMFAAGAALTLALCGGPAAAQVQVQETVILSDLDLSTASGQASARRRLRAASARLCHQVHTPALPRAASDELRCRRAALTRAQSELSPQPRSYAGWD